MLVSARPTKLRHVVHRCGQFVAFNSLLSLKRMPRSSKALIQVSEYDDLQV